MATSAIRSFVDTVKVGRMKCVDAARHGMPLHEIVKEARSRAELHDLYVLKVLESFPGLAKTSARRILSDLGFALDTYAGNLNDDDVHRIETAIGELVGKGTGTGGTSSDEEART